MLDNMAGLLCGHRVVMLLMLPVFNSSLHLMLHGHVADICVHGMVLICLVCYGVVWPVSSLSPSHREVLSCALH
jgi:hypothetical protein